MAGDVGESRLHGRDERVLVKSFFQGGEYLYRRSRIWRADGKSAS
jgi:hypothetical protein